MQYMPTQNELYKWHVLHNEKTLRRILDNKRMRKLCIQNQKSLRVS